MHARFSPHFTFVAKLEGENGQAGGLPVLGCDIGVLGWADGHLPHDVEGDVAGQNFCFFDCVW
jgi:hypothetical protein